MLGIIGAMEEEIAILKTHMLIEKEFNKAGMTFIKGQINKKPIVLVRSGIGKVNAAMCTQILIDFFEVDAIVNTGIAGAIDNILNIGDVVISTDVIQTDFDATGFGYEAGQIPRMDTKAFKADEDLIDLLLKQCQKKKLDINVVKGRISTMDKFVSENELKNKIKRDFNAYCTEMGRGSHSTCSLSE